MMYCFNDYKFICKNCGEKIVLERETKSPCLHGVGNLEKCEANLEAPYHCLRCYNFINEKHFYIPKPMYSLCQKCKEQILPKLNEPEYVEITMHPNMPEYKIITEAYDKEYEIYLEMLARLYKENKEKLKKYEFSETDEFEVTESKPLNKSERTIVKKEKLFSIVAAQIKMKGQEKEQKMSFVIALKRHFPDISEQKKLFKSPQNPEIDIYYPAIFNELKKSAVSRTGKCFRHDKVGGVDYYIPGKKLIIEYDEGQHFSPQRQKSLENYPENISINFDKNDWISACENFASYERNFAFMNKREGRVEQRAFYDSVKDIEAAKHGYKLIRIMHKKFDWINSNQSEIDEELKRLKIIQ